MTIPFPSPSYRAYRLICVGFLLVSAISCTRAQNKIDGGWQGQATGPTGQHVPLIFSFHAQDTVLAGTMISPMGGDTIALTNGSIHGNQLSFDISFGKLLIHHIGEMVGDSIKVKTSDQRGGGMSFVLGRVPQAK
jgi:hypothetical protein